LATIVLSQQAGSPFSEIAIRETLSKSIGEKLSELLNSQKCIEIGCQKEDYG
jgi:hypothetical protein